MTPSTGVGRAIGYLRVSTESQAESGLGLEAQQTAIDGAASRLGLSIAQTFTDTVSGGFSLEHRPALLAALEAIHVRDVLLVAKRDRLGRDVLNVAMIERLVERRGARVYSAAGEGSDDDGPTGRLMRQIIDAFAEYERAVIRARTRAAMAAAKKRGQRVGRVPFGMAVDHDGRTLVPNPNERAVLAEIHRLRNRGYALFSIAQDLNARGWRNRQDRPWQANFIGQLLSRHPENRSHM